MQLSASDHQALEASPLFRGYPLESLGSMLDACRAIEARAGDTLLQPGAENHSIFIVLKGELRVQLAGFNAPPAARLGRGDCAGEISLVDGQGVSAWVVAVTDARLLAMPHELVWALTEQSHAIARNLLSILSGRVRSNNLSLVAAQARSLEFDESASVDALTGLHNRRWLFMTMPRVLQRCERDGQPVVVVFADTDRFMRVAEHLTPLQRDRLLREVAQNLAEVLRAQDLIARDADDRFVIVLTRTEIDAAMVIAERLRERVAFITIEGAPEAQLTLSCGLARHRSGETLEDFLARATQALQRAKDGGRDCIEADSSAP